MDKPTNETESLPRLRKQSTQAVGQLGLVRDREPRAGLGSSICRVRGAGHLFHCPARGENARAPCLPRTEESP